VRREAG